MKPKRSEASMDKVITQAAVRFRLVHRKPAPISGSKVITMPTNVTCRAVSDTGTCKCVAPCQSATTKWMRTTATNAPRSHFSLVVKFTFLAPCRPDGKRAALQGQRGETAPVLSTSDIRSKTEQKTVQ